MTKWKMGRGLVVTLDDLAVCEPVDIRFEIMKQIVAAGQEDGDWVFREETLSWAWLPRPTLTPTRLDIP